MMPPAEDKRPLSAPSDRLEAIPPYMFAELERKIEAKRSEGIDVISLGIGDPDTPTFRYVIEAMREAVGDPSTHTYPSNRGRAEFREAFADFYLQRFGVEVNPDDEVIPAIGAKECIYNLCFAFLDPGDVALAADPGYPVYTAGPILAGAEPHLMPLLPESGFVPDLDAIPAEKLAAARLMFINYPNNPTGAVVADGFFERVVELAREHRFLVVHDNAYSETTYDGYVAPSFLADAGRKGGRSRGLLAVEGLQHDRLALRGDPREPRCGRHLLAPEDERRLRAVRGRAAGRRGGTARPAQARRGDVRDLRAPPRPRRRRAGGDRRRRRGAERHDLHLGARARVGTPRPRSPSSSSRRRASSSLRARCTGRAGRASFGSR